MLVSVLALLLVATPADTPAENPEAQAEDPQEELICRRRIEPSHRVGERNRTVRVCKTRAEWDEARNGNRPRN